MNFPYLFKCKATIYYSRQQWSDWGLRVTQNACFLLMTHNKQLLLVTVCDTTARTGASFRTDTRKHGRTEGQTDVEVEIII